MITSVLVFARQLLHHARQTREAKKYAVFVYIMHLAHFALAARKPNLTHSNSELIKRLLTRCWFLREEYHPTWYLLNNGHLHTIMVALSQSHPRIQYDREIFTLNDGGIVSLDWATPHEKQDRPTVVMLHGLTGGSHDNYVCVAVDKLVRAGWQVVVMNARGCAQTPVLTPKLFCAAYTDDLRQVVAMLRAKVVPTASLVSVGFSLGSNIMVKYIGEEGERCPLTAAVSVGNPYDIVECTRNLTHSLLPRLLYSGEMAKGLVSLFFERSNAHEKFATYPAIDLAKIRQVRTPSEFDEDVTRRIFGYDTVSEFYRDASCAQYLKRVRIPLLCLTADDDPICVDRSTPHDDVKASDYIILATTTTGGHLGFYSGNNPFETPDQWSSNAIVHFCRAVDVPLDGADEDELDASEVPTTKSDLQDQEIPVLHVAGAIFAVACVVQAVKWRHSLHKRWWM
ncbi:hypothetical protein AC1031_019733 [Aphanomyces cochlioides]|nr:hypothetical protein AC1031_019733 [Aphanomyces cochlioides]